MIKFKLAELLITLTLIISMSFISSCNFECVGADCSSYPDVRFNIIDNNGNDLFFGDSTVFSQSDIIIEYPNGDQLAPQVGVYFNEPDTSFYFFVNGDPVNIFIQDRLIDTFTIESGVEESQCCTEYYASSFEASRLQVIDSTSFFIVLE